jgi:two-component system LytT family response regulator
MKIRALVVDDMQLARDRLLRHLQAREEIEVIGECAGGREAIEAIHERRPDLLFLDVQMPEVDGFQVLEAVGPGAVPVVIFVTAYDQFAMRAFEVSAVDYLLKPFTAERLAAALARARQQLSSRGERAVDARLAALLETIAGRSVPPRRMALKLEGRTVLVATDDIDYVEAAGNYVRVIVGREAHIVRERLSQMEATLDPGTFVRIHRSTVLNVNRIREMQPLFNGDQSIVLHNGTRLTLSRTYRDRLFSLLDLEGQRSQTTGGSGPDPGP